MTKNDKPSFKAKLRYAFENTLSSGTIAIIGWLAFLSFLIILIAGIFISFLGIKQTSEEAEELDVIEAAWQSMMHALDAGALGADTGWGFRFVMFLVTIGGIFILSTLIGVLTSGFEGMIDNLRKGRTKVLENNHTLILGWSSKIFDILSELVIANESQRKSRIVILANKDKVEMEDEIRLRITDTKSTRIICRTGSPLDLADIEVVSPNDARSIIIISPEEEENPDTHVIKSVLAITNNPRRKKSPYHIVAEIEDEDNMEAANLVGGEETTFIFAADLLSRVTAQTCRQSGLSAVYSELLDFEGVEIYFKEEALLVGKSFKEAIFSFENAAVFGLQSSAGLVMINPPMDRVLIKGDKVICIAEDDSTIRLSGTSQLTNVQNDAIIKDKIQEVLPIERTLIIGWNIKGAKIIKELENYVADGSEVVILSEDTEVVEQDISILGGKISKQKIKTKKGNITKRAVLNELDTPSFDHIILLSYMDETLQEADAKTLICLLNLRNIAEQANKDFSIVSEMRDINNKVLAEVTKIDDFIVGANLISLMLSQLSENKDLKLVFENLFSAEGSEIYLKPIGNYILLQEKISFATLLESATQKGEIAIGYRIESLSNNAEKGYGVVINPPKSAMIDFKSEDKLIVIAE